MSYTSNITEELLDGLPDVVDKLVKDAAIQYVLTINMAMVCAALSLYGIVSNCINIVVFCGMGFKDTVNISLVGLAVSDLLSLISLLWVTICMNPLFMYSDVPINTFEIQYKTGSWTHFMFTRVSAFITAYITLERCLCIAFPLKIKTLLTPKRVVGVIVSIYVVILGSLSLNYTTVEYVWKFVPSRNRTILSMVFKDNRDRIQRIIYVYNPACVMVSFISVIVCSLILIWKLNERSRWLNSATGASVAPDKARPHRDRQVIKMVVCVASIFIISFTPSVLTFFAMFVNPEINIGRRYENLFLALISCCYLCDAINSSLNLFIYYKMSSKYANRLLTLFCCSAGRNRINN